MNGATLSEEEILSQVAQGTIRSFSCIEFCAISTGSPTVEDYETFQPTANNILTLVNRGELIIEDEKNLIRESMSGYRFISAIIVRRPSALY